MRKDRVILAMAVLLVFGSGVISFANEISWEDIGGGILDAKTVLVNPDEPQIIYLGSGNGLFKSEDGGTNWRNILSLGSQKKNVNFLLLDPKDKNTLYAATNQGLYYSSSAGKNWNRIFMGKNSFENECTTVAVLSSGIYLGTKAGLFVSKDKGRTWHKVTGKIGDSPILAISYNVVEPDYIYVACLDGVFKSQDAGEAWERIFVSHPVENGDEWEDVSSDKDEEERFSEIRYVCVDPGNTNHLYVATSNGAYLSKDKGKTWEAMTDYGLLNRETKLISISLKSNIYAVTKSGVFEYKNGRWYELSLGITANEVRFLAQDNQGNLYAACDNGLFKAGPENSKNGGQGNVLSFYAKDEPKINEVQEAAIKYAEVGPQKIKLWRKQAAKKALLPQVSVGIDRNTADLWHWEGGSTTKMEDDILRKGNDSLDWDVTLSWNLADLIWNDDQANIDVRSRLMVELRDDILDQVTKLYFERLRVKIEMDNLSIEDRKKRFEKELRIEELTAMLDALTGGYFSQQIRESVPNS